MRNFICLLILVVAFSSLSCIAFAADSVPPKKLLVVSTSTRNRFAESIDVSEKALSRFAEQTHSFTIDFVHQPEAPQPKRPKPPVALKPNASAEEQASFNKVQADYLVAAAAYPAAEKKFEDEMKQALQKLSPESLKNYDAVVFCYTSGDLPLPDKDAFIAWIKAGHGFVGIGNAMETMVSYPPYYDMLGGTWVHFKGPQEWRDVEVVNADPKNPANKGVPARWTIREFNHKIPNFTLSDPAHTHETLYIEKSPTDGAPGHFPMAWCHDYGQGRAFYMALGANQDLWDTEPKMTRKNSPETAQIFQASMLGGVLWALGLDSSSKSPSAPAGPSPV